MKRYKRGDASDNTYALVYGGVNPDWAIQDPVIVFEGDADWDQVSAKVGDLSPSYTDHYSNDLYRLDGHSIIKTPKYTTLANHKWILSETLLSSWMWDDLFDDWKANESFKQFINESESSTPVLDSLPGSQRIAVYFNRFLGHNWIEVDPDDNLYSIIEQRFISHNFNKPQVECRRKLMDLGKAFYFYYQGTIIRRDADCFMASLTMDNHHTYWINLDRAHEADPTLDIVQILFDDF